MRRVRRMHAAEPRAEPARAIRFGVRLEGLPILLPAGALLEFLPQARIWHLPLASAGVAGLTHLRGHPIPVFDPGRRGGVSARREPALLVIGEPPHAAAVLVDGAPVEVGSGAGDDGELPRALLEALARDFSCPDALGEPWLDGAGRIWWPLDPERLFAALAGLQDHRADAGLVADSR